MLGFNEILHKKAKRWQIYLSASVVFVLIVLLYAFAYRAELSLYVWNTWGVAPEYALTHHPENAVLLFQTGNYYFNVYGDDVYDLNKAERYYIEALQTDPMVFGPWFQLARISFLRGQFALGLYRINKQLELHPPFPAAFYVRGLIYGFDGQYKKAQADFEHYLAEYKPESPWGHNDLAWFYYMEGDFSTAADVAARGLEHTPDHPWLLNMLGIALMNDGRLEEAREPLERAYEESQKLTEEDWASAYPGNDPAIRAESLAFMRETIRRNLESVVGE